MSPFQLYAVTYKITQDGRKSKKDVRDERGLDFRQADVNMSIKAKGILIYRLFLPEYPNFSVIIERTTEYCYYKTGRCKLSIENEETEQLDRRGCIMDFTDVLIRDFHADADRRMAFICRVMMALMAIVIVLNLVGVFKIGASLYPAVLFGIAVMFIPTILYNFLHINSKLTRYSTLTMMVLMSGVLYAVLSYHVIIMLAFPVIVSCLYCDRSSVLYTTVLSLPVMVVSHLIAFALKIVPDEPLVTLRGVLLYGVLPRSIELIAISVICLSVTNKLQRLIGNLIRNNNELYDEQQTLVNALAEMVEARSHETGYHIKRVAAYTRVLCEALGLSREECWKVSVASMLHDVGKLEVPKDILQKPARLTAEEFEQIKLHTGYGYELLKNSPGEIMQIASVIAQQHHEWFDGSGYPLGLKGDQINRFAACVSIADVFDALVSSRCYKEAWPPEKARSEILSLAGRQFDPELTALFDQHFDNVLAVLQCYPDE